eukprot:g21475.t1
MKQQLLLKALLVNTDGKIVDAVHTRNITCFQSAVRLTARAPPQSQKDACCGTIWARCGRRLLDSSSHGMFARRNCPQHVCGSRLQRQCNAR